MNVATIIAVIHRSDERAMEINNHHHRLPNPTHLKKDYFELPKTDGKYITSLSGENDDAAKFQPLYCNHIVSSSLWRTIVKIW